MFFRISSIILVAASLVGCGKPAVVEAEFQPYLDSFYSEAQQRGKDIQRGNISIHFGELPDTIAAHCVLSNSRPSSGGDEVVINPTAWNAYSKQFLPEREIVVFHELGHCLLGLEHEQGTLELCDERNHFYYPQAPLSIMKSDAFVDPSLYADLRTYYVDQLFDSTAVIHSPHIHQGEDPVTCKNTSRPSEEMGSAAALSFFR